MSLNFLKLFLIESIYFSEANISKFSKDALPLGRLGSIPDYEQGEVELPRAPPPFTDLPVLFDCISTVRRRYCIPIIESAMSWMLRKRLLFVVLS